MRGSVHRLRTLAAAVVLSLLLCACASGPATVGTPEWVERGGNARAFPGDRYLTGFAQTRGREEAVEQARQQAAADLARQIRVEIEANVVDVTRETDGRLRTDLTSQIQTRSEIRLDGLRFELHRKRRNVWALAVLERLPAAVARRRERDRALARTERCLDEAAAEERAGRTAAALVGYRSCRTALDAALEHETVATALLRGRLADEAAATRWLALASRIDERIRALPHEDARSLREAADRLAAQLARSGIHRGRPVEVAPLTWELRDVSSPFGREFAIALESAIARTPPNPGPAAWAGARERRWCAGCIKSATRGWDCA